MSDFLLAALPWVVTGIAIAFVIVNLTRKKTRKSIEIQKGLDEEIQRVQKMIIICLLECV